MSIFPTSFIDGNNNCIFPFKRGTCWRFSDLLRPAGSDPEVVCQKDSFLKVSVSLGGFGPSVAHGKHSVRRRCIQATKKQGRNLLSP